MFGPVICCRSGRLPGDRRARRGPGMRHRGCRTRPSVPCRRNPGRGVRRWRRTSSSGCIPRGFAPSSKGGRRTWLRVRTRSHGGGRSVSRWWIAALLSASGFPVAVVTGTPTWAGAITYLAAAGSLWSLFRRVGNFRWWVAAAFPVVTVVFVAVFFRSAWMTHVRRSVTWRGRTIDLTAMDHPVPTTALRHEVHTVTPGWSIAAYSAAWGSFGIASGWLAHKSPVRWFARDSWLTRMRPFEHRGRWYDRRLRVRWWKDRLPEAGGWFRGGWSKDRITSFARRRSGATDCGDPSRRVGALDQRRLRVHVRGLDRASGCRRHDRVRHRHASAVRHRSALQPGAPSVRARFPHSPSKRTNTRATA